MPVAKPQIAPIQDHPEYKEVRQRLVDLQLEHSGMENKVDAIKDKIAALKNGRVSRAQALVDGKSLEIDDPAKDLAATRQKQIDLREAIPLMQNRVNQVVARLSAEQAKKTKPAYSAIVRKMLENMVALAKTAREEQDFCERLEAAGYQSSQLCRVVAPGTGTRDEIDWTLDEYHSIPCSLIREAVEAGHIDREDPLVKAGNVLRGNEDFLPETIARLEKERQKEAQEKERLVQARTKEKEHLASRWSW
jgi:hypothetical protein